MKRSRVRPALLSILFGQALLASSAWGVDAGLVDLHAKYDNVPAERRSTVDRLSSRAERYSDLENLHYALTNIILDYVASSDAKVNESWLYNFFTSDNVNAIGDIIEEYVAARGRDAAAEETVSPKYRLEGLYQKLRRRWFTPVRVDVSFTGGTVPAGQQFREVIQGETVRYRLDLKNDMDKSIAPLDEVRELVIDYSVPEDLNELLGTITPKVPGKATFTVAYRDVAGNKLAHPLAGGVHEFRILDGTPDWTVVPTPSEGFPPLRLMARAPAGAGTVRWYLDGKGVPAVAPEEGSEVHSSAVDTVLTRPGDYELRLSALVRGVEMRRSERVVVLEPPHLTIEQSDSASVFHVIPGRGRKTFSATQRTTPVDRNEWRLDSIVVGTNDYDYRPAIGAGEHRLGVTVWNGDLTASDSTRLVVTNWKPPASLRVATFTACVVFGTLGIVSHYRADYEYDRHWSSRATEASRDVSYNEYTKWVNAANVFADLAIVTGAASAYLLWHDAAAGEGAATGIPGRKDPPVALTVDPRGVAARVRLP